MEVSRARFLMAPCGRRSGKTAIAKRKLVLSAITVSKWRDANFFAGAPTRDQAKRIFWQDLKDMIPKALILGQPKEVELMIPLINGAKIYVLGMDKTERAEGIPWNGGVFDEYANMKASAWEEHMRPALTDRLGWCWFIGVPDGRNHYWRLFQKAKGRDDWTTFTWFTEDILPLYLGPEAAAKEIADAKRDMDELTYKQEYEASFLNFEGRAYYPFDPEIHAYERAEYDPDEPIIICLDFNVAPGVAVICQEQKYKGTRPGIDTEKKITVAINEVWIPRNSNTPAVCRKIIDLYGAHHKGLVFLYGDATGGARGTAQVRGTDWDIVRDMLKPAFGNRLRDRVKKSNPRERVRLNAVNSRIMSADGTVHLLVDPKNCPHLIEDLEGVSLLDGGAGEIDKKSDPMLTHLSDGLGYYIAIKHPIAGGKIKVRQA